MKLYIILGAILFSFIVGAVGGYYFEKSGIADKLLGQQVADVKACDNAQTITKGANDALQKDTSTIASTLDANELRQPATCVCPSSPSVVSGDRAKHANGNGNGISSTWLRKYAAQCETYRSEVGVCVSFLDDERKLTQPAEQE